MGDTREGCSYNFNMVDVPESGTGSWMEYSIWDPRRHNPAKCIGGHFPRMCDLVQVLLVRKVPLTRVSVSEVLPPYTRIPRHHSPQQGRIRLICPLEVAEGSSSRLIFPRVAEIVYGSSDHGKCWWFDESWEHEMIYEGDVSRASLVVDVPHPALIMREVPLMPELGPPDVGGNWR